MSIPEVNHFYAHTMDKYNIFVSFYNLYNIDVIFCLVDVLTYLIKTYTWSRGMCMWKLNSECVFVCKAIAHV